MSDSHHGGYRGPLLDNTNYASWSRTIKAYLQERGVWQVVIEEWKAPASSTADADKIRDWGRANGMAAGALSNSVTDEQRVHFQSIEDDSVAVWKKLKEVHQAQRPGVRFQATVAMLSLSMQPDESLATLVSRAQALVSQHKSLCPTTFTADDFRNELAALQLLTCLPPEMDALRTHFMTKKDITAEEVFTTLSTYQSYRMPSSNAFLSANASAGGEQEEVTAGQKAQVR